MTGEFNENLRVARLRKKLTQQQVADKLGIAKSTYCQYETGASEPNVLRIKELAKILETTGDMLLGIETNAKTCFDEMQERYGTERLVAYMEALSKLSGGGDT
jgi:transcriptional regulator with XRE-family HTH domain